MMAGRTATISMTSAKQLALLRGPGIAFEPFGKKALASWQPSYDERIDAQSSAPGFSRKDREEIREAIARGQRGQYRQKYEIGEVVTLTNPTNPGNPIPVTIVRKGKQPGYWKVSDGPGTSTVRDGWLTKGAGQYRRTASRAARRAGMR